MFLSYFAIKNGVDLELIHLVKYGFDFYPVPYLSSIPLIQDGEYHKKIKKRLFKASQN